MEKNKQVGRVTGLFDMLPSLKDEIIYYLNVHGIHDRPANEYIRYEKEVIEAFKKGHKFYFEYMYQLPVRLKNRFRSKKDSNVKRKRDYDQENNRRIVREYDKKGVQITNAQANKIRTERIIAIEKLKAEKKKEKLFKNKDQITIKLAHKKIDEYIIDKEPGVYSYSIFDASFKRYDDLYVAAYNLQSSRQAIYNSAKRKQIVKKNYIIRVVK